MIATAVTEHLWIAKVHCSPVTAMKKSTWSICNVDFRFPEIINIDVLSSVLKYSLYSQQNKEKYGPYDQYLHISCQQLWPKTWRIRKSAIFDNFDVTFRGQWKTITADSRKYFSGFPFYYIVAHRILISASLKKINVLFLNLLENSAKIDKNLKTRQRTRTVEISVTLERTYPLF